MESLLSLNPNDRPTAKQVETFGKGGIFKFCDFLGNYFYFINKKDKEQQQQQ